jgi:ATP-dependent DNA ligase
MAALLMPQAVLYVSPIDEGIVSKRKLSPYRSGPSWDWRKIKTRVTRAIRPGAQAKAAQ